MDRGRGPSSRTAEIEIRYHRHRRRASAGSAGQYTKAPKPRYDTRNPGELMWFQVGNYNGGMVLNLYKGEIQIVAAQETRDGRRAFKTVFPRGKDGIASDAAIPLKIDLGRPEQALGILRQMAAAVQGLMVDPEPPAGGAGT